MRYELSERSIDAASEQIVRFLNRENVDSKEVTRIRLSAEEVRSNIFQNLAAAKILKYVL